MVMPILFRRDGLDVVPVPYHNIPLLTSIPLVVTIHDLIIYHFDTGKASTLMPIFYRLRRAGYLTALKIGLARARSVVAVSQTTKDEILDHFRIKPAKVTVTYEGVRLPPEAEISQLLKTKPLIAAPYFLYVGNAYPHKNLETLTAAFGQYRQGDDGGRAKLGFV